MDNNLISDTISDILDNADEILTKFTGFDCKRKYRNRQFKIYHKKGIFEDCPILSPVIPSFAFKILRKRLESRF